MKRLIISDKHLYAFNVSYREASIEGTSREKYSFCKVSKSIRLLFWHLYRTGNIVKYVFLKGQICFDFPVETTFSL